MKLIWAIFVLFILGCDDKVTICYGNKFTDTYCCNSSRESIRGFICDNDEDKIYCIYKDQEINGFIIGDTENACKFLEERCKLQKAQDEHSREDL